MAKKSSAAAEPEQSQHAGKNVVKFFVNQEAHAKIQLAAAMSGRSMGAFCRDLVMEIVDEMTAKVPRLAKHESIVGATRRPRE